ncbi:MAG: DUF4294 domain-containing protein [Bacteroides sp.]|nr:DUF4294 domain-containing protein [Bacteroides sp.]MBR4047871.1 DUF4294 domain-containing protein [Bacteroides sp.]
MKQWVNIMVLLLFLFSVKEARAQQVITKPSQMEKPLVLAPMCVYEGDTIPYFTLPTVHIFKPIYFKNNRERQKYNKLVRDVKKVLPLSKEIRRAVLETYEVLQTLPTEKARNAHIKAVEKSVKKQYTPIMKKLTFSQGKLLIKLVDRQTNSTGYELVKAFMGPLKAGFYQAFAALFGASLKKEYDATGDDAMVERVIILVESGQI